MPKPAMDRSGAGPSVGERVYDGVSMLLLAWPATGGMWLMGSTRVWGYAPGLVLSLLGSLLVVARPLAFRGTAQWTFPAGIGVFALLTAYVAILVPFAAVPYAARWEALRWASLLAALFSWTQIGVRGHRWKWLLAALLLAATLDSLYALIQHANGSRMVLWAERAEQYGTRASGTFLCPNHLANVLAMLFPLALALLALREAGFPLRLMALYFLGVSAPVLYWTQSRSGWLGMGGGVAVSLLLLAWRKSRGWLLAALAAIPLAAVAAGVLAWHTLPAVRERVRPVLENPEKAGGIRVQMWRDAPEMFRDKPAWGFGGGSFVWVYPPYQRNVRQHLTWDYLHNDYLQMLLEHGAAGFGLAVLGILVAAGGMARAVLRARSKEGAYLLAGAGGALAACLIHALFDFNFRIFPNPHVLVWVAGVAWGTWAAGEPLTARAPGRWRMLRMAGAGVGAGLCAWCAWTAFAGGMSYRWNLRAEMARAGMEWDRAPGYYEKAMAWDSGNWQPHVGLGKLKAAQGLWYRDPEATEEQEGKRRLSEAAAGHFRDALALNAFDMEAEFGLARALQAMGDSEGALEHYRRAATYQRRHVFYREQLGIQLRRMGRDAEALEAFRRNVEDRVATDVSVLNIQSLERKLARQAAEAAGTAEPVPLP